jgi:hypothetical protein
MHFHATYASQLCATQLLSPPHSPIYSLFHSVIQRMFRISHSHSVKYMQGFTHKLPCTDPAHPRPHRRYPSLGHINCIINPPTSYKCPRLVVLRSTNVMPLKSGTRDHPLRPTGNDAPVRARTKQLKGRPNQVTVPSAFRRTSCKYHITNKLVIAGLR